MLAPLETLLGVEALEPGALLLGELSEAGAEADPAPLAGALAAPSLDLRSSIILRIRATSADSTFLRAEPSCTSEQRSANLREHSVSLAFHCTGLMLTNMRTLESPERESCSKKVSFELR